MNNSIATEPVNCRDISRIISSFKIKKSTGPYSIPATILISLKDVIAEPLSRIINPSSFTGVHQNNLKIAEVITTFKKGSKLKTSNYRQISLLSNLNKIFEKIVFDKVYEFKKKLTVSTKINLALDPITQRNMHL